MKRKPLIERLAEEARARGELRFKAPALRPRETPVRVEIADGRDGEPVREKRERVAATGERNPVRMW